ncbi:MAG TPA: MFS transporter [Gemmatimonadales bacterium]|nr:MFS transporter [Gemmatimonadales bacterium]
MLPRVPSLAPIKATLLQGPLRALRHRNFSRFATGQTISLVGTWMQSVAQGWLVLDLTGSAFDVGMVTTLGTLPILLFTLYGGVVADRVEKRRFILLMQTVMLLEAAALAALTLTGRVTVEWVWALAFVHGLATAFEVPARQSFLVELVPAEDLVSAAALNSTIYNLARVIGPAIAGVVLAIAGPGACFAINAVSYFAVLVGLLRITHRGHPRPTTTRPSVFTGLRFIQSRPLLAALSWQMVFVSVFAVSFIPILPVFAREVLRTDAAGYGAMTSAIGVGAALGAIVTGGLGKRVRRTRMATVCALGLGIAVMLLAVTRSTFGSWLVLAIGGAAMAGTGIATATSLQLAATPELRGRVMAVYSFVVLGLAPIGAFQAGWVAEHFGSPVAIALSGAVCVAGTWGLKRRLWDGKEE